MADEGTIMRCLYEGFASTVMTRSSRCPRQFLSRSYRAVHSDMTLFCTTHNPLMPKVSGNRA
jgi:hypothetical protein